MTSTHSNAEVIRRFYEAFSRRDGEAMAACYSPEAVFGDPVFPQLEKNGPGDMWRMLCEAGKDLRVEASGFEADDREGKAEWVAHYTFRTGRKVVNRVRARFRFQNGLIVEHRDEFDFPKWAGQALGMPGYLLGWTGWMQRKVQQTAAKGLRSFQSKRAGRSQ